MTALLISDNTSWLLTPLGPLASLVETAPNKGLKKVRAPFPSPLERLEGLGHVKVDVEVFCCVAEETVYSKSSSKAQKIDFPVTDMTPCYPPKTDFLKKNGNFSVKNVTWRVPEMEKKHAKGWTTQKNTSGETWTDRDAWEAKIVEDHKSLTFFIFTQCF